MAGRDALGEAVRHDFSWKEDPSMQIRRRRENTSHPPEKSQVCHLSHGALSPLIHPSVHPSRPVSTAFASYSHIKAPSRLLCARPLSSAVPVSRYLMFLSTPLIPHLHLIPAAASNEEPPGRRPKTARVNTNTLRLI